MNEDDKKDLSETRDQLVSVLAHDLRNPISAIQMRSALILQDVRGGEQPQERIRSHVAAIQRHVASMTRLIESLLDADRIAAGMIPMNPRRIELVEPVTEVVSEFLPLAQHTGIIIDVIMPDKSLQGNYDPDRIRQVLGNLVSNALKFSPRGSTVVMIIVKDVEDLIMFEVHDQAALIPEDKRDKIFHRGVVGTQTLGSAGLGLWISRWIVEQMGGKIWVEPTPNGQHNAFKFTLPRHHDLCPPTIPPPAP